MPEPEAVPAAVVSTQTFGDYPERFHPHLHVLATDGCFYREGLFRVAPKLNEKALEKLFRVKVLAMLLRKKKISPELIRRILEHLRLWLANARPIPRAHSPPGLRPLPEDSYSQLPAAEEEDYSQFPPAHWDC